MDTLPDMASDMVSDPVVLQDGVLCLRLAGRTVPLRMGTAPVESFLPGWRPMFLYTGLPPFGLLQFVSDSGIPSCPTIMRRRLGCTCRL